MKAPIALVALLATAAAPIPADVVDWVRTHALAIGDPETPPDAREAAAIHDLVAGAQLIALGEPGHGHAEPLLYRNRLIRHLVTHEGLTAIALESGIADTAAASDFVAGGAGDARGAAASLSWGFDKLEANVDLLTWLRRWNDAHPRAKVRLYGIDVSGGDTANGFGNARVALDLIDAHLARASLPGSAALRTEIARIAPRFSATGYAAADAADRAALNRLPTTLAAYLAKHRTPLSRIAGAEAQARAERVARDAGEAIRILAIWPEDATRIGPALIAATGIRERAMIAHTAWALRREGPHGRMLLFQSNTHVAATELVAQGRPSLGRFVPTGEGMRRLLGARYRVILFASALGRAADDPAIGSVDSALVAAKVAPALLDIRRAPGWWDMRQTLAHGGTRVNAGIPKRAFDGLVFVDRLTPAAVTGADR